MPNSTRTREDPETSFARRVYRKYREGGVRALASSAKGRFERWIAPSALYWARLGAISASLGNRIETQGPTILVLSLPRSGSSWVGVTLGSAANALYLREPLTQTHLQVYGPTKVVFRVDPSSSPEVYRQAADIAFSGIPTFSAPHVVAYPQQWNILSRRRRRLVIKEVNPMAVQWLLQEYHPRVIFLVRHPAAVALSFRKKGWFKSPIGKEHGEYQGAAHRSALDSLMTYDDYQIVFYEELCANPMEVFRGLFDFAGLIWDRDIEAFIQERTSRDIAVSGTTHRNSRRMLGSWRGQLSEEELENLRAGYIGFDLPWYTSAEDWC